MIVKVMKRHVWEQAKAQGEIHEESLLTEGFIHCSFLEQATKTAEKHFAGETDLVLLKIDPDLVQAEIKYERASNGKEYPHVYGPINIDAVTAAVFFVKNENGEFVLPMEWQAN
ncbi:DUF952 domain-containing protein [Fictibacillus gelatini]|uniref:DUF952 domain-containing protein n=1 Tax=Fictibacillus gelatini TaxID=225985 RepID=UPI000414A60E|nr:DUF952 domain-containing protein [Fictibacillus gelatini]